jgi:hypothetical protein
MFGKVALIVLGLAGVAFGVRALFEGTVRWIWIRFGAWGSFGSDFDRDDNPVGFWFATLSYLAGGVFLALFGVYRLLGN